MVGSCIADAENAHLESHDKVECRPHLHDAEDDGRHAGKARQSCSEGQGSLNHQAQRMEDITSYPKMNGLLTNQTHFSLSKPVRDFSDQPLSDGRQLGMCVFPSDSVFLSFQLSTSAGQDYEGEPT